MAKVLLVDDEPRVLRALSAALDSDYDIHTSESAAQAQALIASNGGFDVIISDEVMPGSNGHELLNWCRKNSPKSKRIMLTGIPITTELRQKVSGADDVVIFPKPWNITDIKEALNASKRTPKAAVPDASTTSEKNLALIVDATARGREVYSQLKRDRVIKPVLFDSISELLGAAGRYNDIRQIILNGETLFEQHENLILRIARTYPKAKILITVSPSLGRVRFIPPSLSKRANLLAIPFSANRLLTHLVIGH
ncbi:response regulator [Arenicella xantha]|uniref:Response regulator receiver domain-containing protein n=1 Tax=Arenicella xantha TaxID=644221 RepID=A0A395JPL2_9GAMM|nr:response regulator [Arenicella xantha]RBP53590.1 response regulator receiver domain-containing protein [Arenicella xantha]